MKKYQAVIFDLDGTLLDTITDICASLNEALSQNGYNTYTEDECKLLVGSGVKKLVDRAMPNEPDEAKKEQVLNEYRAFYSRDLMKKTRPFANMSRILQELNDNDIKIAVVSNKPDNDTKRLILHYFPDVDFTFVSGSRKDMPHKPDPSIVTFALNSIGVSNKDAIFVGDSDVDILTGKNANMATIGATWGYRSEEELKNAGADFLAQKPYDLLKVLL